MGDLLAAGDLMAFLGTRTSTCEIHGEYESDGKRFLRTEFWSPCPDCDAEEKTKAERKRIAAMEEMERIRTERERRKIEETLGKAAIPQKFIGRSFDGFIAESEEQRYALNIARKYANTFAARLEAGQGMVFSGSPGTGKSHLAAAIMQAIMSEHTCLYATAMDLVRAVRSTWRKDSDRSEDDVLGTFTAVDLLVIDEVGVQYGSDGEQNILYDVIDRRYCDIRPTILITNQGKSGFLHYIGERNFDRLRETSKWVPFGWESHRARLNTWGDV